MSLRGLVFGIGGFMTRQKSQVLVWYTVKPRYNEIFQTLQISHYNEVLVISRIYINLACKIASDIPLSL
jgi:hypothetical protein